MSNDLETRPERGVMKLVSGIVTDVHMLTEQQLALFRQEIKDEIRQAQAAGSLVAAGMTIVVIGSVLLCVMLVHFLESIAPQLPSWACYGVVGAPVATLGGIICFAGLEKFRYREIPNAVPVRDPKRKA